MRYPAIASIASLLPELDQFDAIIDVRSPSEFALDHIPGASNFPVLDDDERIQVGTMYKQIGAFEAKKLGAALVSQNIARHLLQHWQHMSKQWRPLIYCWRGGNRSGAMAHVLAKIGWPVFILEGGYKAYRHQINDDLPLLAQQLPFKVICGPTGSGKSRLLQQLSTCGAQVLDLEHLAHHRGSVLGHLPATAQPSQKAYESAIWDTLRRFSAKRPVYVEAESKKVGNLRVPDALMLQMRNAPCISLQLAQELRVKLLLEDYVHFVDSPNVLLQQLEFLRALHSNEQILRWQELVFSADFGTLVQQLLQLHYDPAYQRSIERNFSRYSEATQQSLPAITPEAMRSIAHAIIANES